MPGFSGWCDMTCHYYHTYDLPSASWLIHGFATSFRTVGVRSEAFRKEVRWHDVTFTADDTEDHDRRRELGLHDVRHVLGRNSWPPVILRVHDFLVLTEVLLVREEPKHVGFQWMFQFVDQLLGLLQPLLLHRFG